MNKQQQNFVNEMLRHGDKTKAYRSAYPDAQSGKAIESSVNRLLKHPEVKQAIDEPNQRIRAEVEAELKEKMRGELLDFYECQKTLAQIIRGQYTTTKQVRVKDGFETVEVKPTINNVLTALNTFFRLNNHYPQKKTAAQLKAEEQESLSRSKREKAATAQKWEPDPELKRIMEKAAANPYRHPWGDIYPPEYRGPWYDPNDPNTKEQFLAITEPYRLKKLQEAQHASPANLRENTTIKAVMSNEVQRRENYLTETNKKDEYERSTSPQPMQADRPERQDYTAEVQEISPYGRNDDPDLAQQNTTTHNNSSYAPSLRGTKQSSPNAGLPNAGLDCFVAEPPRNDVNPEKAQQNTTENACPEASGNSQQPEPSLEEQIAIKYKHVSDRTRQMLLRDALRKQGWQTIDDAFFMVNDVYLRNQHSGTIKMMKLFEKAKNARNYPPHLREPIEKETGWTFHPKYPNMMRRTRALGW